MVSVLKTRISGRIDRECCVLWRHHCVDVKSPSCYGVCSVQLGVMWLYWEQRPKTRALMAAVNIRDLTGIGVCCLPVRRRWHSPCSSRRHDFIASSSSIAGSITHDEWLLSVPSLFRNAATNSPCTTSIIVIHDKVDVTMLDFQLYRWSDLFDHVLERVH